MEADRIKVIIHVSIFPFAYWIGFHYLNRIKIEKISILFDAMEFFL